MGALLDYFAAAGVVFELAESGRLDAIGALNDDLRVDIREHKRAIVAELLAANHGDLWTDDRRRCDQCKNLSDEGQCRAAFRGEALGFVAPRIYYPVSTLPQHCGGLKPFPDDPDQRPGYVRWPSLLAETRHG